MEPLSPADPPVSWPLTPEGGTPEKPAPDAPAAADPRIPELETKLDEIGIAALADDIVRAENSPGDMLEVTRMLQRPGGTQQDGRRAAGAGCHSAV